MMRCHRCVVAISYYGSQVTCWFSTTQRHYTIWACTIQRWMRRVQGLHNSERKGGKQSEQMKRKRVSRYITILFYKKRTENIMLACWQTKERPNERRSVCTSGKWIFNGNIYIGYLDVWKQFAIIDAKRTKKRTHTHHTRSSYIVHILAEKLNWKGSRVFHSSIVAYEQSVCIFIFLSFSLFASLVAFTSQPASVSEEVREKWRIARWMPGMVICYINF